MRARVEAWQGTELTYPEALKSQVRFGVEGKCDTERQRQNVVCDKVEERSKMLAT